MRERLIAVLNIAGIAVFLLMLVLSSSRAEDAGARAGRIEVTVSGFRSARGKAYVALWRGKQGFPGKPPASAASRIVSIAKGSATARFEGVTPGSFAITVFHDEDGDTELSTNFFGIPKEGLGFSNGARIRFGAPSYASAELKLAPAEQKTVAIALQYL